LELLGRHGLIKHEQERFDAGLHLHQVQVALFISLRKGCQKLGVDLLFGLLCRCARQSFVFGNLGSQQFGLLLCEPGFDFLLFSCSLGIVGSDGL
jgi:hypothetical protein